MATNEKLETFLASETAPAGPQEPPQPPAEKPAAQPPAPESKPPEKAPEPAAKATDKGPEPDDEPQAIGEDGRTVPFAALEKVRNDWKSKHAAAEARAELLAKQLEEARRAPPPTPPAQPQPQQALPPPPDPAVDPRGYAHYQMLKAQHDELNRNLNVSEWLVRDRLGDAKVDEAIAAFRAAAEQDAELWRKLYSQPMPYAWMVKEMDRAKLHADIGDDPVAYRERILAEERAKWEAEYAQRAPAVPQGSPVPAMAPSLANARSVAARTAPAWTGETSMEDMLRGVPSRVRSQRA